MRRLTAALAMSTVIAPIILIILGLVVDRGHDSVMRDLRTCL